jgi:GSH-dependent disulfide-bond oxidoreductase
MKVALFLEESGQAYLPVPIDTRKGEQHQSGYTAINPNAKVPALIDDGITIFDSNAILLYLAEKTGQFLPEDTPAARAESLSWLMFIATGIGPFSGQSVHFKHYATEQCRYSLNRYDYEAWRHWRILDQRLGRQRYMIGDTYSYVDMALWGWCRAVPFALDKDAWLVLPHVKRLFDEINSRPAAVRVAELVSSSVFKKEMDSESHNALFPQNIRLQLDRARS